MISSAADERMIFKLVQTSLADGVAARVGRLALPQRKPVDTPNYVAITSRGSVPHMTPDVITKHTQISAAYMGLEDFIEKSPKRLTPAIFKVPQDAGSKPLHSYTATPSPVVTILGARRHPAVVSPMGNGRDNVSVFTSTGFKNLTQEEYGDAVATIQPDVVIPLADLTYGTGLPNAKRQHRMAERTEDWMDQFFKILDVDQVLKPFGIHVFAPLLPVPYSMQWTYLNRLAEDHASRLSGLAVYHTDVLADMGGLASLTSLPRLSLDVPLSPHHILRQIRQGIDVFAVPFINGISDAGIALSFTFPPHAGTIEGAHALGIDMWSENHKMSLQPLAEGCDCYACTKHHCAYMQHLLNAKEMLGWTLLQVHNHCVMDKFFEGIRAAITDGSFERKVLAFTKYYVAELPRGTGERPRARGYHFKPEAGQTKINPAAWGKFEGGDAIDKMLSGEATALAITAASAEGTEIPLVTQANGDALNENGCATIDKSG